MGAHLCGVRLHAPDRRDPETDAQRYDPEFIAAFRPAW